MKIKIEKNIFLKSLEEVGKAIDSTNIYIHLRNFYIEVLDNMIIIKGSNGYLSIETKIENSNIYQIEKIGSILVPATLFLNIIKRCTGLIEIESNNNIVNIKNNKDNIDINLLNINDYPQIDFTLYGNKIKVNAEKLRRAIENVIFATTLMNEEIILTGINLKYEMNKLFVTATDNFRLAREIIEIVDDRKINFDITISNKNIKNLIPQNINDDIEIFVNEHKINVVYKNSNFQSKIIDAPYKNVESVFQIKYNKEIIIDKNILNNAISKATVISSQEYNKIFLSINKNEIILTTNADEIGRTKVVIENKDFQFNNDETLDIVLNYKYLKEAINVFNDKIIIYLKDSKGPIQITDQQKTNTQIISPMMS